MTDTELIDALQAAVNRGGYVAFTQSVRGGRAVLMDSDETSLVGDDVRDALAQLPTAPRAGYVGEAHVAAAIGADLVGDGMGRSQDRPFFLGACDAS